MSIVNKGHEGDGSASDSLVEGKPEADEKEITLCQTITEAISELRNLYKKVDELAYYTQAAFTKTMNKDKSFDILHKELSELRANRAFEKQKSFICELLLIQDRISNYLNGMSVDSNDYAFIKSIQGEITALLAKKDVSIMPRNSGTLLDPTKQKVLKTEIVDSFDKNNTVLQVLRDGYLCKDVVIRFQEVIVGLYKGDNNSES